MKAKLLSFLKSLFVLALGLLLLYYVFKGQDLAEMLESLKNAKYKYLVFSMLLGYLAYVFRALRWVLLLETMNYNVRPSLAIHSIAAGYFANVIFPRAGEVVRCTSLYKVSGVPVDKLFGTIILERAIDLILLLTGILLSFVLKFSALTAFFSSITKAGGSSKMSNSIWLVFSVFLLLAAGLYYFREHLRKSTLYQKLISIAFGIKEGFQTAFYMKQKGLFFIYTLLIWGMYLFMTYVCFFSIPETSSLTIVDGLYITIIGGLGMVVPVQGGVGSYHVAVTLGIVSIGLSEATGLTLAVLIHSAQSIMILATGIIAAIVLSFTKRKFAQNESSKNTSV